MKRFITGLLVLCAIALPVSAGAKTTTLPKCQGTNLVVWLDTQGDGAAGSVYYNLKFTNLGPNCTLYGYPAVVGINLQGKQLGTRAGTDPVQKPKLVTLKTGDTKMTVLQIADVFNYPNTACSEVTAAGIRVTTPGQKSTQVIPFPFNACGKTGPVYLHVEAVQ